jgi:Fungal specific transcription factor domain
MNSRASSEFSDSQPSYLAPNHAPNGAYSPGPSPFSSPFARTEDSFRPSGLTGRIDGKTEDELFLEYLPIRNRDNVRFFTKFHPTLPVVDNALTPAQAFNVCPLLYHTILLLATLATPNHTLTWALSQTVNSAAPQQALSPNKSVYLVQAFLLLATWPQTYPQGATINDQAWMYVGVATHMAQCLGIHRSFLSSEYSQNQAEPNEGTRREWVRTWVGCFIVGQLYTLKSSISRLVFLQHLE